MNKIEYVDIVSKPVGKTYERVQTLGIYCWQYDKTEKRAAYFLPRFSFNTNKNYLENIRSGISENEKLQGKGIFSSLWRIRKFYNKVSVINPEAVLFDDIVALSAFKAWVDSDPDLKVIKESGDENNEKAFKQMYVLENEVQFDRLKYTEVQNSSATVYYDLNEILGKEELPSKSEN